MNQLRSAFLFILISVCAPYSFADAIKCRDSSGKIVITDGPCPAAARVERVQGSEYISAERRRQAYEVNDMVSGQLKGIEAENTAFNQRQAEIGRQLAEDDRRQAQQTQRQADDINRKKTEDDCIALSKKGRSARYEAMAKGCAWGFEADRKATEEREQQKQPNPIVTSCDQGGCWDTKGNRYTGSGQTLFRSKDGRACSVVGSSMVCN